MKHVKAVSVVKADLFDCVEDAIIGWTTALVVGAATTVNDAIKYWLCKD